MGWCYAFWAGFAVSDSGLPGHHLRPRLLGQEKVTVINKDVVAQGSTEVKSSSHKKGKP